MLGLPRADVGAGMVLRAPPGVPAALIPPEVGGLAPGVTILAPAAGPPMPGGVSGRLAPLKGAGARVTTGRATGDPFR